MSPFAASRSLKLSSAVITADSPTWDRLLLHRVSVSAPVLRDFEVVLATTRKSREAAGPPAEVPPAEHLELQTNPTVERPA